MINQAWTILALGLLAGKAFCQGVSPAPGKERLYVGTYTLITSLGIYQSSLDLVTGALGTTNLSATTGDPSFLALHPSGNFLYAVNEGGGSVVAFAVDRSTGGLTLLNQQPSGGATPCHLVVYSAGKNVLVANYIGGSVRVFPIQPDGRLSSASNALNSLTYQLYQAPALQPVTNWSLLATGLRGQSNFILTNISSAEFFRASVLTN